MSSHVNERTLVPLGIAVVVIGGLTTWAVDMKNEVRNHSEVVASLTQANEAHVKLIYEINSRLSRIEWKLEFEPQRKGYKK